MLISSLLSNSIFKQPYEIVHIFFLLPMKQIRLTEIMSLANATQLIISVVGIWVPDRETAQPKQNIY